MTQLCLKLNMNTNSSDEKDKCIFTEKNGGISFHNNYGIGFFLLSLFLYFEAFTYLFVLSIGYFTINTSNIMLIMSLDVGLGTVFFFSNSNKGKNWYTYLFLIFNICARLWSLVIISTMDTTNNNTTESDNIYLQNILFETTIVLCICLITLLIFAIIYLCKHFKNNEDKENV